MSLYGYSMARNPDRGDGLWRVAGRRITIYVKREFGPVEGERAARELVEHAERTQEDEAKDFTQ